MYILRCNIIYTYRKDISFFPLQFLKTDFLGYLREWQAEIESVPMLSKGEVALRQLSRETLEGLHISGKRF